MSRPARPDIEALKQLAAVRRADERYNNFTIYPPSEADRIDNTIAYIEYLEQMIRAAIIRLEADGPYSALKKLEDALVPDA